MNAPRSLAAPAIEAGGAPLPARFLRQLTGLRVQQRLSMPSQCELDFADPDGALQEAGLLAIGKRVSVRVPGADRELFRGEVTGVDCDFRSARGAELHVRGYDLLHRLALRQTVRTFVRASLAEIAGELSVDLGVTVRLDGADADWDHVVQHEQTDLHLLAELAQRRGMAFVLEGDTLRLFGMGEGTARLQATLGRDLLELTLGSNALAGPHALSVRGWNTRTGQPVAAELAGPESPRIFTNRSLQDEFDASGIAAFERDQQVAARRVARGVLEGRADVAAGAMLVIDGVPDGSRGPYPLCAVNHVMRADSGYVTEFDSEPIRPPTAPSQAVSLTLGIVVRTDDPGGAGRVQLVLPAFGDISTDWVRSLTPFAGKGKGLMAQPDIDDRVAFLFFESDPAQGVVIGSVWGADGPPRQWAKDARGQRYTWLTPGGHCLLFDDAEKAVRIESANGSFVEMTHERMTLHSATDLRIEAPGKSLVVSAATIDFRKA